MLTAIDCFCIYASVGRVSRKYSGCQSALEALGALLGNGKCMDRHLGLNITTLMLGVWVSGWSLAPLAGLTPGLTC